MAYTLFTRAFGSQNANSVVSITQVDTGKPATVLTSATGGVKNNQGQAMLDSSGNLSVYLDDGATWEARLIDGSIKSELGNVLVVDTSNYVSTTGGPGTNGKIGTIYQDKITGEVKRWSPSAGILTSVGGTSSTEMVLRVSSTASRATNNATFASQVADMDPGQVLRVPAGTFDVDFIPSKTVRILGSGKPVCNGTVMVNGTIIRGEINIQDRIGAEIGFLGINQVGLTPSTYPNLITAGLTTTGDSTTRLEQYIHDVEMLGRGFANGGQQAHGLLVQNGRGVLIERAGAWKALNNFISRASGVVIQDSFSFDAEQGAVLFKSASAGGANDCFDNLAFNVRGFASGAGYQAIFSTLSEDGAARSCNNNQFMLCLAQGPAGTFSGAAGFAVYGSGVASGNRGTRFTACTSRRDGSGTSFLVNDDFSDSVMFSACNAELFSGFSFSSNSSTATNLPVAVGCSAFRSGFENIVNGYGRWARLEVNGQEADVGQTLASLGPAGFATRRRFIRDSTTATPGGIAAGGGSIIAPVYDDGTNWRIG